MRVGEDGRAELKDESMTLRNDFMDTQHKLFDSAFGLNEMLIERQRKLGVDIDKLGFIKDNGEEITKRTIEIDMVRFADNYTTAKKSKVVLFDSEQVYVFFELINQGKFLPSIEYRLPFTDTWIQFTQPIAIDSPDDYGNTLRAMCLSQVAVTKEMYTDAVKKNAESDELFGARPLKFVDVDWEKTDEAIVNNIRLIFSDDESDKILWTSESDRMIYIEDDIPADLMGWREKLRRLAAACIAYINCENVYLHKEGEVDEKINRKREKKGKSRLEPYYVCRIRGVNYDSVATGEGAKHGIRYDVRGHFRRLADGRTTWVRPHQRGLVNELYVPKTYKVEAGSKPAWTDG